MAPVRRLDPAPNEWAANIARLMDAAGVNQTELARLSGLTKGQVTRLLNDPAYNPEVNRLRQIVEGLRQAGLQIELWQLVAPADLAERISQEIQYEAQLTTAHTGDHSNAPAPQEDHAAQPQAQAHAEGSVELSQETLRAASLVLDTIRYLTAAPQHDQSRDPDARALVERLISRTAQERNRKIPRSRPKRPDPDRKRTG